MNIGLKYDNQKPCMAFLLKSFPNALRAAAQQNDFGARKYEPLNWQKVSSVRYVDALVRHFIQHLEDPTSLDESGQTHLSAVIWNALAIYELQFNQKQNNE